MERKKERESGSEGEERRVEARHEEYKTSLDGRVERGERTCGQSGGRWKREKEDPASPELVTAEEAWGSGSTPTAQPGGEFGKFRSLVDSQSLLTFQKNDQLRQPGKSESHRQCQPEIFEGPCQHLTVMLIRSDTRPDWRGEKTPIQAPLHREGLWANPFQVKRYGREGATQKFEAQLKSSTLLQQNLHQLSDKVLLCYCALSEPCHRDVLIRAWEETFPTGNANEPDDEAAQAEPVEEPESQSNQGKHQEERVGEAWDLRYPQAVVREPENSTTVLGLCSPATVRRKTQ